MPSLIPEAVYGAIAYDAVRTQWRTAGMTGARVGLDYGACGPVLRLLLARWGVDGEVGIPDELELMEDVQVVELAILEVDQERASDAAGGAA